MDTQTKLECALFPYSLSVVQWWNYIWFPRTFPDVFRLDKFPDGLQNAKKENSILIDLDSTSPDALVCVWVFEGEIIIYFYVIFIKKKGNMARMAHSDLKIAPWETEIE